MRELGRWGRGYNSHVPVQYVLYVCTRSAYEYEYCAYVLRTRRQQRDDSVKSTPVRTYSVRNVLPYATYKYLGTLGTAKAC